MIDFHSHVLPGLDDGSKSVEESLRMLRASAEQGVRCMAATPHFYPAENNPERFLARRESASYRLKEAWRPGLPRLLLGAEVCYFDGMSRCEELADLRIEGTALLLLEMPFQPWTVRMTKEIRALHSRPGFTVALAHIERYLRFQKRAVWDELLEMGVLMQCNAEFFLRWNTKHRALHMLETGRIHLLGSDCHNMTTRPPRLGKAMEVIGEKRLLALEDRCAGLAGPGGAGH